MPSMSLNVAAPSVSVGGSLGGIGGSASVSIAAPSLKIEAPKISMPSMNLNVAAPNVSVGGNIGVGSTNASVNLSAPSIKVESIKINMPKVTMPSISVATSAYVPLTCDKGHPIHKFLAGVTRNRWSGNDRKCGHCKCAFKDDVTAAFTCNEACDYDCCEDCYKTRFAEKYPTSVGIDGFKIQAPKIALPSMSLNVAAPSVSVGGSLGGIGGSASASIVAPKVTMPSMSVNVRV